MHALYMRSRYDVFFTAHSFSSCRAGSADQCHTPVLTLLMLNLTYIMHMQLTGELPFEPSLTDERPIAPDWVPAENRERWEDYEAMLSPLDTWVSCQPR